MNVKISDLMSENVITAQPHHTVSHVRDMLQRNQLHAVPVVASDGTVAGIVSVADLAADLKDGTPVSHLMTKNVYTIPSYNDAHHAARLMRNHKIHHVVVTHEQKIAGILSSFDLLKLVEDRRFVMKGGPTPSKKKLARQ